MVPFVLKQAPRGHSQETWNVHCRSSRAGGTSVSMIRIVANAILTKPPYGSESSRGSLLSRTGPIGV